MRSDFGLTDYKCLSGVSLVSIQSMNVASYELFYVLLRMEIPDETFILDKDWDLTYLGELFREDFYEFVYLWSSSMCDIDLVHVVEAIEKYNPLIEDILSICGLVVCVT